MSGATGTVLDRILAETRETVARRRAERPLSELTPVEGAGGGRFRAALAEPGVAVIAEFKRRSPSAGSLRDAPDLDAILGAYERGGAAAASILTEEPNFGGSLADLERARAVCDLPLLRKDFVIDPYQLHEALAAGADAVLLIVAALGEEELARLHEAALPLGLDVLVEVHDAAELERAAAIGAGIVGVNNRDLRDFSVDVERTSRLMAGMPPGALVVSESGISSAAQLAALEGQGVDAVLVGETLMRAPDPAAALLDLRSF
ncbi:MAG TPA: indole-3-glycerol phosphate synthase TrpC [Solirubrobacteraceae bacterium]|nr:indole-3-glycerol phosphate synthase TrpC [Solirubrobacteraceae bacterium]